LDELREGNETKAKYHIAVYETRESNWAYISLYKPGSETDLLGVVSFIMIVLPSCVHALMRVG